MRNMYPKPCSICQGTVPAGEGTLRREGSGWSLTHTDACPRGAEDGGAIRHGYAQAYTRRVMGVLRRKDATREEVLKAVDGLSALAHTRWTSIETCERILLGSQALSQMERLEAEAILNHLLLEESHA
ncbi:hypothetical protein ACFW2V_13080 [Streptomyces sp. NPDC058947]|uniref:hypothetical protein n=1 Tax=Streptomyces sp. NPDC058947 TaxID=3346675 RepID=UPI0036BABEEF